MKWVDRLVPEVCDVSVTNVCNAACDFCSYARDKDVVRERRWIDCTALASALAILYRRGIRYLAFQGGEPLLHPDIVAMVRDVRAIGIRPALITNGWLLPQHIEALAAAGLGTLLVSIDSHSMAAHEANRGLRGLGERIRVGLSLAGEHRLMRLACVTVNRLVDYDRLPDLLRRLGFDAVTFSYPRHERLVSSSLVYSEKSELVAFERDELLRALDAIAAMKERFPVMNPAASIADIKRHVRGEPERFPCVGGHKYFYLDWNLDIWRAKHGPSRWARCSSRARGGPTGPLQRMHDDVLSRYQCPDARRRSGRRRGHRDGERSSPGRGGGVVPPQCGGISDIRRGGKHDHCATSIKPRAAHVILRTLAEFTDGVLHSAVDHGVRSGTHEVTIQVCFCVEPYWNLLGGE